MKAVSELLKELTLEEKASLCSGSTFWFTQEVERVGVPKIMVSDGPVGLRKQNLAGDHLGVNDSIQAVCFPAGCGVAASFNKELYNEMGQTLAKECRAEDVAVILGPAVNIKRSPLCGRNFEYLSEDPYVAGEMSTAYIKGVQKYNVGTSIKHFAVNSQETRRLSTSANITERALHEIYLSAFEGPVRNAKPYTVMCSYNRINGVLSSENKYLLSDVLRDKWGYEGMVVSDWAAVSDRAKGVDAGLDLEMPTSFGENDRKIVEAVKSGKLSMEALDETVTNVLNLVAKAEENKNDPTKYVFDRDADHEVARRIATEAMVLLKNDNAVLPVDKNAKIAVIGLYASKPRFQGGGSAHINCHKTTSFMDMVADMDNVTYCQGFDENDESKNAALLDEAVKAAGCADVTLIFAGLPDSFESEGYDRKHMSMPESQIKLIEEVGKVAKNSAVLLHNGSPIEMPWIDSVDAILECYLGGQAVGMAQYDLVFGNVNPSGHLVETFPKRLEDNPSFINFPGYDDEICYGEDIFVGYRYYDKKKMDVLFPFGHGLSYTSFKIDNIKLSKDQIDICPNSTTEDGLPEGELLTVSVDVTNTGKVAGKEVVQAYIKNAPCRAPRPIKELKAFDKVELMPGETKTVTLSLDRRSFAYYEESIHDFFAPNGEYEICVGNSSANIMSTATVKVNSKPLYIKKYTYDSLMGDMLRDDRISEYVMKVITEEKFTDLGDDQSESASESMSKEMAMAMLEYSPIRAGLFFSNENFLYDKIDKLLAEVNEMISK